MENPVIAAAARRRSVYDLGKALPFPEDRVREILEAAVWNAPSSYNSQGARVLLLLEARHEAFWDYAARRAGGAMAERMAGFRAACGSILFFEDQDTLARLQSEHPRGAEVFPAYSLQSSGMLQFAVWTALAWEGLGANLQHFNAWADEWAAAEGLSKPSWKSMAQLVFGEKRAEPGEKDRLPLGERLKVAR